MISDYYHRQYSSQRNNTKTIKLKNNQYTLQPFMIPQQHFHPDNQLYEELKGRCDKIKTEFTFIKNQIQREHRRKKQKHQQPVKLGKSFINQQNRDKIQKQMTLTCKKLLKFNQFRKIDDSQTKNKRSSKQQKSKLQSLIGQSVAFQRRELSTSKSRSKNILNSLSQNKQFQPKQ